MKKFHENLIVAILTASLVFITAPITAFAAGPATVNLGSAGDFVILAKSGISTTGATTITGDIGVSPIAALAMTGFGLTMDISNTFSTSALLTGKAYASNYTAPTPSKMTTAISNMETAYTNAAGRTNPTATGLGAGNIGGMTLAPGLYKWETGVTIPTDVTLSGNANDVWIFQIAQNLTLSSATKIVLSGGAQASNIFWQVAGQTTLGTNSIFNGIILDQTAVVLNTGATLNGRALAQTAVTLDANAVSISTVSTPAPTPTATISANPTIIVNGQSSTITWSSTNAASCSGANFSTGNAISGSVSVSPTSNATYSINCEGASDSVMVAVTQPTPAPTPVNGSCSSTHYNCNVGNSTSNVDGSTAWAWSCAGLNSGTTTSCSETKSLTPATTTPTPTPKPIPTPTPTIASTTTPTPTPTAVQTTTPILTLADPTIPNLPNTGVGPDEKNIPWNIIIPAGLFTVLTFFYFARRKQTN